MGLDMYLTAKRFLWSSGKDVKIEGQVRKLFPEMKDNRIKEVSFEMGYWRKANAIHLWFVENLQEGADNCENYSIDRDQLKELKDCCKKVISSFKKGNMKKGNMKQVVENGVKTLVFKDTSVAQELLPTQSGSFFGDTDYDEWYFSNLKKTIRVIDRCLAIDETYSFEYSSSW